LLHRFNVGAFHDLDAEEAEYDAEVAGKPIARRGTDAGKAARFRKRDVFVCV
jgi:hypothetical protein